MATLTIKSQTTEGTIKFSISADRFEIEDRESRFGPFGRWVYYYRVELPGYASIVGNDLRSGSMTEESGPDLPNGLRSLLSFAYVETQEPSEDGSSWSADDHTALYQFSDEISLLALEMGEG